MLSLTNGVKCTTQVVQGLPADKSRHWKNAISEANYKVTIYNVTKSFSKYPSFIKLAFADAVMGGGPHISAMVSLLAGNK